MKVYFETLGCPKNFNDTQAAKGILEGSGHVIVEEPELSQVIIVNTCGFINDAKRESIDKILEMSEYKAEDKKLIVSGCLSKRYGRELSEEMPEVDYFIGVNEYESLPEILEALGEERGEAFETAQCEKPSARAAKAEPCTEMGGRVRVSEDYPKVLPRTPRKIDHNTFTSTIKIAEGCDNRCAYCIIPSIRGGFRSKAAEDVVAEAEDLAAGGCKELILIAQDVTNYGIDLYGRYALPELLTELCRVEGIEWIRLMYCYEDRITDELIEVMAREPKVCKYIDIPLQHASDGVLKAMRRRSTVKSMRETIGRLRAKIPDIHIRTTFIVGFPGETEKDFDALMDFAEETGFSRLGVFAYSQEENTAAGAMENQVPERVKQERLDCIMGHQADISLEQNKEKIGSVLRVLVEERDTEDGSYIGRSQYDAPEIDNSVLFTSSRDLKAGEFVDVLVRDAFDYDLVGEEVQYEFTK